MVKAAVEALPKKTTFPVEVNLTDGTIESVLEQHVKPNKKTVKETGEWYIPHVIEPAFGIDRIIWHVIDHAYNEHEKNDELYTVMRLSSDIVPVDVAVFPLFEKDGRETFARELHQRFCMKSGFVSMYDGSGSIGRRYARADEIGIPWAVTIDHQSLEDDTVTIRRRDDQKQVRTDLDGLIGSLKSGSLSSMF